MRNPRHPAEQPKPTPKKELHFFPGTHQMVWIVDGKVLIKAEAWGGEAADPLVHYDVMKPRPTTPGRYVIYSFEPYRTDTWPWSRIAWGTKLILDADGKNVLFETGLGNRRWSKVEDRIPGATPMVIRDAYRRSYGNSKQYDPDGDGIPSTWVFNDFGPAAVRYFRDKNRDKKLNKGESLSGEMIHTTPDNEAQVVKGETVTLEPSHGCIHISPLDRDKLRSAGAFDRGIDVIIHQAKEAAPPDPP